MKNIGLINYDLLECLSITGSIKAINSVNSIVTVTIFKATNINSLEDRIIFMDAY